MNLMLRFFHFIFFIFILLNAHIFEKNFIEYNQKSNILACFSLKQAFSQLKNPFTSDRVFNVHVTFNCVCHLPPISITMEGTSEAVQEVVLSINDANRICKIKEYSLQLFKNHTEDLCLSRRYVKEGNENMLSFFYHDLCAYMSLAKLKQDLCMSKDSVLRKKLQKKLKQFSGRIKFYKLLMVFYKWITKYKALQLDIAVPSELNLFLKKRMMNIFTDVPIFYTAYAKKKSACVYSSVSYVLCDDHNKTVTFNETVKFILTKIGRSVEKVYVDGHLYDVSYDTYQMILYVSQNCVTFQKKVYDLFKVFFLLQMASKRIYDICILLKGLVHLGIKFYLYDQRGKDCIKNIFFKAVFILPRKYFKRVFSNDILLHIICSNKRKFQHVNSISNNGDNYNAKGKNVHDVDDFDSSNATNGTVGHNENFGSSGNKTMLVSFSTKVDTNAVKRNLSFFNDSTEENVEKHYKCTVNYTEEKNVGTSTDHSFHIDSIWSIKLYHTRAKENDSGEVLLLPLDSSFIMLQKRNIQVFENVDLGNIRKLTLTPRHQRKLSESIKIEKQTPVGKDSEKVQNIKTDKQESPDSVKSSVEVHTNLITKYNLWRQLIKVRGGAFTNEEKKNVCEKDKLFISDRWNTYFERYNECLCIKPNDGNGDCFFLSVCDILSSANITVNIFLQELWDAVFYMTGNSYRDPDNSIWKLINLRSFIFFYFSRINREGLTKNKFSVVDIRYITTFYIIRYFPNYNDYSFFDPTSFETYLETSVQMELEEFNTVRPKNINNQQNKYQMKQNNLNIYKKNLQSDDDEYKNFYFVKLNNNNDNKSDEHRQISYLLSKDISKTVKNDLLKESTRIWNCIQQLHIKKDGNKGHYKKVSNKNIFNLVQKQNEDSDSHSSSENENDIYKKYNYFMNEGFITRTDVAKDMINFCLLNRLNGKINVLKREMNETKKPTVLTKENDFRNVIDLTNSDEENNAVNLLNKTDEHITVEKAHKNQNDNNAKKNSSQETHLLYDDLSTLRTAYVEGQPEKNNSANVDYVNETNLLSGDAHGTDILALPNISQTEKLSNASMTAQISNQNKDIFSNVRRIELQKILLQQICLTKMNKKYGVRFDAYETFKKRKIYIKRNGATMSTKFITKNSIFSKDTTLFKQHNKDSQIYMSDLYEDIATNVDASYRRYEEIIFFKLLDLTKLNLTADECIRQISGNPHFVNSYGDEEYHIRVLANTFENIPQIGSVYPYFDENGVKKLLCNVDEIPYFQYASAIAVITNTTFGKLILRRADGIVTKTFVFSRETDRISYFSIQKNDYHITCDGRLFINKTIKQKAATVFYERTRKGNVYWANETDVMGFSKMFNIGLFIFTNNMSLSSTPDFINYKRYAFMYYTNRIHFEQAILYQFQQTEPKKITLTHLHNMPESLKTLLNNEKQRYSRNTRTT